MRTGTFIIGLSFILAGVIALLINLGYGTRGLIIQLQRMWPIIIIIIGISLLGNGKVPQWLGIIIILALVGGVVFLFINAPRLVFYV
ncbi:MAG: DUF5668 domain-containing protein [Desulfotomaculaceae bacterium]|nr:DUF5668 domain-containing protein [Desulfotomaculaceae bacterium]